MLNYEEIKFKLINIGESVKAEVFYDMNFKINHYDFFLLKFQKESKIQDFLKRYTQ